MTEQRALIELAIMEAALRYPSPPVRQRLVGGVPDPTLGRRDGSAWDRTARARFPAAYRASARIGDGMSDHEVRAGMRAFVLGAAHQFSEEELRQIEDAALLALRLKTHQKKLEEAEVEEAEACAAMGPGWTVAYKVYSANVAKTQEHSDVWDAPVTLPLFVVKRGAVLHILRKLTEKGKAVALCRGVTSTDKARVLETLTTITVSPHSGRAADRTLCSRCFEQWAPLSVHWLPKQTKEALNWKPRERTT